MTSESKKKIQPRDDKAMAKRLGNNLRQAISTKYVGATNTRGSRVRARAAAGRGSK